MKSRGIKDLYLPKGVALHVKFMLFCVLFSPLWGLIIGADINWRYLLPTFLIMLVDMEVIYLLSKKIFIFEYDITSKYSVPGKFTRDYLFRLLLFYVLALAVITLVFAVFVVLSNLIRGNGFPDFLWLVHELKGSFIASAIAFLFVTPVFFFIPWQESMKREYALREQNLIFQNETLKNQVNPHFLFNSLNTLSSLVNTEVAVAGQFIAKLSVIYRYILDNSSKQTVSLNEEISFIRDYYYLHQIRNEGKIKLEIDINSDGYSYKIIPISLQLLVENAIKHNMATQDKPLTINVYLEGKYVVIKNNIRKMATQVVSTKIGLKNLNERVRLVTVKEIIVTEQEGNFIVKVPLTA